MKKLPVVLALLSWALSSCAAVLGPTSTYSVSPLPAAPAGMVPSGTVSVSAAGSQTVTRLRLSELAANTVYVGQYHLQGTADMDPCKSRGAAITAGRLVGQSSAGGTLNLSGTADSTLIIGAASFDVYTARDASGTLTGDPVACAVLKR